MLHFNRTPEKFCIWCVVIVQNVRRGPQAKWIGVQQRISE